MMQPKIKRRNYADPLFQSSLVDAGMKQPVVSVNKVACPMHPKQVALMLDALRDFSKQYELLKEKAAAKKQEVNPAMVISKMTALRKIATTPERLNTDLGIAVYDGPNGGGKMVHIKGLADQAVAAGKKVLILTDFQLMQVNCEQLLAVHNPIRMLTTWGDEKRDEALSLFADDPDRKIFIAGTRAIREGIDLSPADVTICTDLLWSPAFQCQAWSRTMAPTPRERECQIYLMLSQNSLDEHVFNVFYSKLVGAEQALDRKVMNRRAMDFDVKFFAERVLEEEAALSLQLRDMDVRETALVPDLDLSLMEERVS
jgi:SNF2 family DNA or RNA helicase